MESKALTRHVVSNISDIIGFPYCCEVGMAGGECLHAQDIVQSANLKDLLLSKDLDFEKIAGGRLNWTGSLMSTAIFGTLVGNKHSAENLLFSKDKFGKYTPKVCEDLESCFYNENIEELLKMSDETRKYWIKKRVQEDMFEIFSIFASDESLKVRAKVSLDKLFRLCDSPFYRCRINNVVKNACEDEKLREIMLNVLSSAVESLHTNRAILV